MPSIELPPNVSPQGIALAREITELIVRHFSESVDAEPETRSVAPRQTNASPGGDGPFGVCPDCGVGSVVRKHRRDGGSYIQCSNRDYQDKSTCQFVAWNQDEQDAFFAGKPMPKKVYKAKKEAPSVTASAAPNLEIQEVFRLIALLKAKTQPERNKILKPFGYNAGTSFVLFLKDAPADIVANVAKELE